MLGASLAVLLRGLEVLAPHDAVVAGVVAEQVQRRPALLVHLIEHISPLRASLLHNEA